MSTKTRAWLIRHAECSASGIWNAPKEPLTEKGKDQARLVASKIIAKPDLIVVSPFLRSQETARPIIQKWPTVPVDVWQIQEITYLDPNKFQNSTLLEKKERVNKYWQDLDPLSLDGKGAETFTHFVHRLQNFDKRLHDCQGFIVVVGHGQFIKAYEIGKRLGFAATSEWMKMFREEETARPIANCEILEFVI